MIGGGTQSEGRCRTRLEGTEVCRGSEAVPPLYRGSASGSMGEAWWMNLLRG